MHTTLAAGYKGLTGDPARIRQGDDFLSEIVPMIMASKAYKGNGVIILWWDESESDGVAGDNPDDFSHTIPEIIISPHAHPNVDGVPYASPVSFTHSSDLRTMQEIFRVRRFLGNAANANDLSDLFQPGALPKHPTATSNSSSAQSPKVQLFRSVGHCAGDPDRLFESNIRTDAQGNDQS